MASVLARGRVLSFRTCTAGSLSLKRGLHQSAIALAKKKPSKAANNDAFADEEDMFGFSDADDDLFSSKSSSTLKASPSAPAAPDAPDAAITNETANRGRTLAKQRTARFNTLYKFTSNRVGLQPKLGKFPEQIRDTVWQRLFQLAATQKQISSVVSLFPKWRDMHRKFTPEMSDAFIRRCEELHCPKIALRVFSNHPKYGVDLTAAGARRLMHALHVEYPISNVVLLAALHSVYRLPPVSSDLVSCALFTSACFKAGTVGFKRRGKAGVAAAKGGKEVASADAAVATEADASAPAASTEVDSAVETIPDADAATAASAPEGEIDADTVPTKPVSNENALVVAEAMVPQLQALLEKTDPAQWAYPPGPRVRVEEKEKAWLTWTLAKIEKALVKREEPVDWLRQWRERCGQGSVQGAAA